jgi:hypothetical protein
MNLPSVTEIISFVNPGAFAGVPPDKLLIAQERGIAVHQLAAGHAQGLWVPEIPDEYKGYYESATRWFDEYVEQVFLVEKRLVSRNGFTGMPDLIVHIRGDEGLLTVADWKTPKPLSKTWRLQLAGYYWLARDAGFNVARVASLRLDAKGGNAKFNGYTKTLKSDLNIFVGLLNYWKFANE